MKYLLVIGFCCNVYRREPRARLFFNERLIDEFDISHTPEFVDLHDLNLKHLLEPYTQKTMMKYVQKHLPFLRFYYLDIDDQLQQAHIKINIDNNDSNYTNGFITKSTVLQFKILSLLPADKKIYEWFKLKARNQRNTNKYAWHCRKISNHFFTLEDGSIWIGNNGKKIYGNDINYFFDYNIGGSGSLHCELIKKYGILLGKLRDPKHSYIYKLRADIHNSIYNKYEQHENLRNIN